MPRRELQVPWARLQPEHFTHPPCPLCGTFKFETRDSLVINWSEFFLVHCTDCGLTWRTPMPDAAFLHDLYSDQYFDVRPYPQNLEHQVGIADATEDDRRRRQLITENEVKDWQTRGILPMSADGSPRKLLEIGGGRGYLQRAARNAGWDTLGLEISPHGIKEAIERRLSVLPVVLDELCERYVPFPEYFDVIVFFDFLEHVIDPGRVLRMVKAILERRGDIILRVPCVEEGETPMYHLVDHIFHFTDRTIRRLLDREGFEIWHSHPSGRFPGPSGQVQNFTYYAKRAAENYREGA